MPTFGDMIKSPQLKSSNHPRYKWEVTAPRSLAGRRVRLYFNDEAEANKALADLVAQTKAHGPLAATRDERLLLARFRTRLTLSEIESALDAAWTEKERLSHPFADICRLYLAAQRKAHSEGRIGKRHMEDLEIRIVRIQTDLGGVVTSDLDAATAQRWLDRLPLGARSKLNYKVALVGMINWAVKHGHMTDNPCSHLTVPACKASTEIYTPEELQRLLDVSDNVTRRWLVLGAFAGLRTSEIERMDWSDLDFQRKEIYVRPGKTDNAERWVPMTPPILRLDTRAFPARGPLLPVTQCRVGRGKLFRAAGVASRQNGLRHSFGSHHLVQYSDPQKTALLMGHHSPQQTFAAYRKAVSSEQAARYWAMHPGDLS